MNCIIYLIFRWNNELLYLIPYIIAPYTIITFPFLFAVMFGDLGHGAVMTLFALWMVLTEKDHTRRRPGNEVRGIKYLNKYINMLNTVFNINCIWSFVTDLEDLFWWPLHHAYDGTVLYLHRTDLQWLFLQIPQHLWLVLEHQGHVYRAAVVVRQNHTTITFNTCCLLAKHACTISLLLC